MTATLSWDGSQDRLITLADELSQRELLVPLDSLDLGDAFGALIQIALENGGEFIWRDGDSSLMVETPAATEGFQWEGID